MERQPPRALSDEIDLYIRTYYSLLRSSGEVKVSAFEEAHVFSNSSLHEGAREATPDVAAFAYSAGRLPDCMPYVERIVLGQSHEQFEAAGLDVLNWERVRTRGRRRPLKWDGEGTLVAFVTSTSDIDDLVPIVSAYQLEWNKLNALLAPTDLGRALGQKQIQSTWTEVDLDSLGVLIRLDPDGVRKLCDALGPTWISGLSEIARRRTDVSLRLLSGSYSQYQRAAQRWWGSIESEYLRAKDMISERPKDPLQITKPSIRSQLDPTERRYRRAPIYFVSSNTHAMINLVGGYARTHREEILHFAKERNPEGLYGVLEQALAKGDDDEVSNVTYYLLRAFLHDKGNSRDLLSEVQAYDRQSGIQTIESPGKIDVSAQIMELNQLQPDRLDPRLRIAHIEDLASSDAMIVNIDYPLGMAAYHHLSRLAQGVGEIRGVYVMGKAATLNGRVGDVMISTVVYDEHSQNTYLYRNAFTAADVQPYIKVGNVFDNQKALAVRGAFLQNRNYMNMFYRDGYTVMEMEAGPYLSATYELVNPNRHPNDEIVHLSNLTNFDVGILHYASDTPYSRRQTLLSKSLSYFGVDSTYSCAIAILRRILSVEVARIRGENVKGSVFPRSARV